MPRKTFDPQRFQSAVRTTALLRAKKAVQAQIKSRGERISDYSCRDISIMASVELERNRKQLIDKATAVVWTFPDFARWRSESDVESVHNVPELRTLPRTDGANLRTNQQ